MTIPAGFPYPLNQEVEIPLEQIIPNPKQPRRSMRQESLGTLAASMKAKGQLNSAKVRPLTEAERASRPGVWVMLVGGHRRRQAALMNGFKTLKCIVDDIAPEDTHYQALMDNDHEEMDWWDWDLAIEEEAKTFHGTLEELGARLDKGMTKIYGALKIAKAFNPVARALVDENLQKTLKNDLRSPKSKNKAFSITETTLLVLADLEDSGQALQALQVVLDDYLTTDQTQKLVEHMQAGQPADSFKESAQSKRVPRLEASAQMPDTFNPALKTANPKTSHSAAHSPEHAQTAIPTAEAVGGRSGSQQTHAGQSPTGSLSPSGESHPTLTHLHPASPNNDSGISPNAVVIGNSPVKGETPSGTDKVFWEAVVGISFIKQLKKKAAKGEPLTRSEKVFALLYRFYESFLKPAGKLFKKGFHWGWDKWRNLGGKKYQTFFEIVGFLLIAWFLTWSVIKVVHTILIPVYWIENKTEAAFHHEDITPAAPTPVPAPASTSLAIPTAPQAVRSSKLESAKLKSKTPNSSLLTSNSKKQAPVSPAPIEVTAWNPSDESQADLVFEIAAVSKETRIKPYAFEPNILDASIAGQRLQDLADPDKYTMRRGRETDKVLGVSLLSTNLIITFKSSDVFDGIAGGSNKASFYWEDVKTIHVNQLVSSAVTLYQCGVISDGMKEPFTIQCPRSEDLKHLVSALEFWIKTAQGKYAPLDGMPYPNQGLDLTNDGVVDKLWADSPTWNAGSDMEPAQPNRVAQLGASQQVKAGVALGDHLWSVGKVTSERQNLNDLEAGLQSSSPVLYVVSASEWNKAQTAVNTRTTNAFRPKLRKVVL